MKRIVADVCGLLVLGGHGSAGGRTGRSADSIGSR